MAKKSEKHTSTRPPRILVPNKERALFTVDAKKMVGVIRRLSLTGGSATLSGGPIPQGTLGEMELSTVFGKVSAQVQFMHTGADGMPLTQAFRFIDMDDVSTKRFSAAVKEMEKAGFSDVGGKESPLGNLAAQTLGKLRDSIRSLSGALGAAGTKS
jgi:hypothetical protein